MMFSLVVLHRGDEIWTLTAAGNRRTICINDVGRAIGCESRRVRTLVTKGSKQFVRDATSKTGATRLAKAIVVTFVKWDKCDIWRERLTG